MSFPFRRSSRHRSLAQIFCCAGILAGGCTHALAQEALRVDPVLLGLPPVKPSDAPVRPEASPAKVSEAVAAEAVPVPAPVVEKTTIASESMPNRGKTDKPGGQASAPRKLPAAGDNAQKARVALPADVSVPAPSPEPAQLPAPAVVLPARADKPLPPPSSRQLSPPTRPVQRSESESATAARVAQNYPAPGNVRSSASTAPLRVDPVLLGLPPVQAVHSATPAATGTESSRAEARPVPSAVVKARPLDSAAPASSPVATVAPTTKIAPAGGVAPAARGQGMPALAGARPHSSALPPLRVDPALLGLPPVAQARTADAPVAETSSAVSPLTGLEATVAEAPGVTPGLFDAADASSALDLRAARALVALPRESEVPRPVFLSAQQMSGEIEREFVAEGNAELRRIGTVVNADRLTYWPIDDEMEGEGQVRLAQGLDVISGPKMRLNSLTQTGFFDHPAYFLKRQPPQQDPAAQRTLALQSIENASRGTWNSGFSAPSVGAGVAFKDDKKTVRTATEAHGEAERIDFLGENQVRISQGSYSTCPVGNDDWYVKAAEFHLDYDREVGEGKDGTLYFKDVPLFSSPWLSFSLNNQRKSGFLAPSFASSSDSGIEFSLPYYWNIAPNRDATFTPRLISKRGLQLGGEFRYLDRAHGGVYRGETRFETLPSDKLKDGDSRYGVSLKHAQSMAKGFSAQVNYNKVSDDDYFTDLSSDISKTSQTQLLQQGLLSYGGGGWWGATVNFQQYQTLQPDAKNPVLEQYKLLPQITLNARRPDFYRTDSSFFGQYSNFSIDRRTQVCRSDSSKTCLYPDGQRFVLYPQVAVPYVTPGWYVTPKFGLNVRHYSLSEQALGVSDTLTSTLPVFSLDSGMTFERSSTWFGRDYMQTLEPRLYYLNIPYKNQDDIPNFDTALADFNFAQIFSENQFTGWDRINSANQLTAAVTSRLLQPDTGGEIMRAMLGQRFYFSKNKVGLTSAASDDEKWRKSDFLAAFSGQILPRIYLDSAVQYNPFDREIERYSLGGRYQPQPGKVFNASYRYNRDTGTPVNQVDLSGQWPLFGRWHGVGRLNYSLKDKTTDSTSQGGRLIEAIAGMEYNGGCWVLRGVVRRQALTQDNASTSFFIQLELNDFARIGSNPVNLLKRNIQGYGLINQSPSESFSDEYSAD